MYPLCIATDGYLNTPTAIATNGYICAVVTTQRPGGGQSQYRLPGQQDSLQQALREDEEIIEIVLTLTMSGHL